MPPAARKSDKALHDAPHCHAAIHPPSPTPTPLAHPPVPYAIVSATQPTVKFDQLEAATVSSQTQSCALPGCVPGGPGVIARGSSTVFVNGLPAAREGDTVSFPGCVGPIPGPSGKIIAPCSPTVIIGG